MARGVSFPSSLYVTLGTDHNIPEYTFLRTIDEINIFTDTGESKKWSLTGFTDFKNFLEMHLNAVYK